MPLLSCAEFARLRGVSKVAVSKAIHAVPPRLILVDGKLDTQNPVNALYNPKATGASRTPAPKPKAAPKKRGRKPRTPDAEELAFQAAALKRLEKAAKKAEASEGDDGTEPDTDIDNLIAAMGEGQTGLLLKKTKVDIELKQAATRKYNLEAEVKKGKLIERDFVLGAIAKLSGILDSNILKVPRKIAPTLHAMAASGATPREIELTLEAALGESLRRTVEETAVAI